MKTNQTFHFGNSQPAGDAIEKIANQLGLENIRTIHHIYVEFLSFEDKDAFLVILDNELEDSGIRYSTEI